MGQLIDNDEKWQFYRSENCERPSNTELKYLKGIIISGSELSIQNTKKRDDDEKIFKKCLIQKQGQNLNTTGSQRSVSNIGSSDTYDIVSLQRQAAEIVCEDQIPQNEPWIENLAEFIRHVYENFPHIKLVGCQFGSLIIAYALGGKIREKPAHSDQANLFIGKEEVTLRAQFFDLPWVSEIVSLNDLEEAE